MTKAQPRLIAVIGPAGSGKTTLAQAFVRHRDFRRVRFAEPLKAMLYALGLNDAEIDGELKEQPCDLLCGHSPRYAMQTLGTEWGRQLMGEAFWINLWKHEVKQNLAAGYSVVVDDCRFRNEVLAVQNLYGTVIRIERPGHDWNPCHLSEWDLHDFTPSVTIANTKPMDSIAWSELVHRL